MHHREKARLVRLGTGTERMFVCPPCRSVVYQQSSRESATLQPFFTLQLDIQSEKIHTVQEALENLVARESVQGYTTRTKQEVWMVMARQWTIIDSSLTKVCQSCVMLSFPISLVHTLRP